MWFLHADSAFQAFKSRGCNWSICNSNITLLFTQGYWGMPTFTLVQCLLLLVYFVLLTLKLVVYNLHVLGIFYRDDREIVCFSQFLWVGNSKFSTKSDSGFFFFFSQTFIVKPYYLKREKQKALENMEKTSAQV